jgi:hypothetical protein
MVESDILQLAEEALDGRNDDGQAASDGDSLESPCGAIEVAFRFGERTGTLSIEEADLYKIVDRFAVSFANATRCNDISQLNPSAIIEMLDSDKVCDEEFLLSCARDKRLAVLLALSGRSDLPEGVILELFHGIMSGGEFDNTEDLIWKRYRVLSCIAKRVFLSRKKRRYSQSFCTYIKYFSRIKGEDEDEDEDEDENLWKTFSAHKKNDRSRFSYRFRGSN